MPHMSIAFAVTVALVLPLTHLKLDAQASASPFVGRWVADLSRSKLDPKVQFKGVTLEISVAGETVTLASELVNDSGQTQRASETMRTDGMATPGTLTPGITLYARWVGPQVLATVADKGGNTVSLIIYQVTSDGATLTARSSGLVDQVIVFTRK